MTQDLDALPLPEPLALLHTGDDFGGERDDPELEFNSFNAATEFCLSKPAKTKVGLHTDDALRDYGQRCYELAKREAQEGREPVEYRRAVMGEGRVAIGCCINPDTGTPGIIYLDMGGAQRPIDADTSDLFEPGKQVDPSKILACVHFLTAEAVHQTIGVLHELLANDFGVTSTPPKSDEARDAERYRVLRDFDSGKTELAICRWSEHGWVGEWVIEHEPDAAIDTAMAAQQKGGV